MGSIYIIRNTINDKVYIGQTVQSLATRFLNHKMASRIEDTKFYRAIRKYGEDNFYIELLETVDYKDLNDREKYWIKYYNSYYNGYNSTLGGDGVIKIDYNIIYSKWIEGKTCSQIAKEMDIGRDVVSKVLKNEFNINQDDIYKRGYEKSHSLSNDFIINKWKEGLTPNQICKFGSTTKTIKKVLQQHGVTEVDFKKRTVENQREATSEKVLQAWKSGLNITQIQQTVGGNFNTIKKILLDNNILDIDIKERKKQTCNKTAKSVVQLSLDGKYINTYPSAVAAGKALGHSSGSSIGACCNHKPKYNTAYNYKWLFLDEYEKEVNKNGIK